MPHNPRIRSLLNQMEDKVFAGKVKLYNVFKKFDKDGDGYVSYEDFENCLKSIKVEASKDEMAQMLKLIDKKGQGHMNFTDFSLVFRPDMSTTLTSLPQNDIHLNNL
jgi:Ca2+-binding EF-hand superfamily protein